MFRTTESWRSTNDSFGSGACGLPGTRGERCVGDAGLWAERCHAALAAVGEGSCASLSERVVCCGALGVGGMDRSIMSYADGVRSTRDASSWQVVQK